MTNAATKLYDSAISRFKAGDLGGTERDCREILDAVPDHASALNLLGTSLRQRGQLDEALELTERAVAEAPDSAFFLFNLGDCLRKLGRLDEAVNAYQRSLHLHTSPQTLCALGHAYMGLRRFEDAANCFCQSVSIAPAALAAYEPLASCFAQLEKWQEAMTVCRQAVAAEPCCAASHARLAGILVGRGQWAGAAEGFRNAIRLGSRETRVYVGLAVALNAMGQSMDAVDAARQALILDRHHVIADAQLGIAQSRLGEVSAAARELEMVLEQRPNDLEAVVHLANIELDRLRHSKALQLLHRALELSGGSLLIHSKVLLARQYAPEVDETALFAEHRGWAAGALRRSGKREAAAPPHDPDKPLRIGYVSPDLRQHSIPYFFEPVVENHDRRMFESVLFSCLPRPDRVTDRLRGLASRWHEVWRLNDRRLADLIVHERIDILVDLSGHTAFNRLPLFARRPAPIQVTYLGYPNTTGLPSGVMNYRITDAIADPPGPADDVHTEKLFRLPGCFLCYKPPAEAPAVGPLPADSNGFVTFGCFNAMPKLSRWLIELWAKLLHAMPTARLMLKNASLGDDGVRADVNECFISGGVEAGRLILLGREPSIAGHLERYDEVDIALDSFPYNGTTTTCEAMWMGVPVVTLAGNVHRSRVGASLLTAVGLSELIANTPEDYVEVAVRLAHDIDKLRAIRLELRERMRNSRLMDGVSFTKNLEAAYRAMWRTACEAA